MSRTIKKGRPTDSQQGSASTNSGQSTQGKGRPTGRVDRPKGKAQYMDQEKERPAGRVDHPTGKAQYMDKEEERPTGRVDHPTGKAQYMDKEEPQTVNTVDKSTMTVNYTVTVTAFGKNKGKVLDLVMGKRRRSDDSAYVVPFKIGSAVQKDMLDLADRLLAAGATVEVKKTITIEISII